MVIAIVRNLILIALFLIAAQISLTAICWFLFMGHIIGASIIITVSEITYRRTLPKMRAENAA